MAPDTIVVDVVAKESCHMKTSEELVTLFNQHSSFAAIIAWHCSIVKICNT